MDKNKLKREEKSLWHNRDYLVLWAGQTVSSFGSSASHIVLPLLILDLTHSPFQAGILGAFTTLPYVMLSLFAGAFADRIDRKKVMILSDIGRALSFGSIFIALLFNSISIRHLYLAALVYGICHVFFDIAEIASLRKIVGKKLVASAAAQNGTTDGLAALLGPSIGTALYQIQRAVPFLADTLSYVVSVISLLLIKKDFQEERTDGKSSLKEDLKEGILWLFHNKTVRFMAFLNAGVSFVFADSWLVLIVLAKEQKISNLQIGTMVSIAAIGGIIGSLAGSRIAAKYNAGRVIITAGWIQAILWLSYVFAPNFIVIGAITAFIVLLNSVWAVVQINYRVRLIPDDLQGRVNSVFRFSVYTVIPLGMLVTGFFLQSFGAKLTIIAFFFILVLFSATATLNKAFRSA